MHFPRVLIDPDIISLAMTSNEVTPPPSIPTLPPSIYPVRTTQQLYFQLVFPLISNGCRVTPRPSTQKAVLFSMYGHHVLSCASRYHSFISCMPSILFPPSTWSKQKQMQQYTLALSLQSTHYILMHACIDHVIYTYGELANPEASVRIRGKGARISRALHPADWVSTICS